MIFLAICYACIEEYIPPSVKRRSNIYLTVNGILFNDDSLKTIILSRSQDAWQADSLYEMVNDAQVTIIDDRDNKVTFHQSESGVYQSLFNPQHERTYQLHIIDDFGTEYLSEQVKMDMTPKVDSVYWKLNNYLDSKGDYYEGIDIMIATQDNLNKYSYYKWDWTETWEIRTPFVTGYEYIGDRIIPVTNKIPDFCWVENTTDDIIIGSTESLSQNQITNKVIHVIPFSVNKLHIRYSIQIRQYALDKNAYMFWNNLRNTNETSGSLFDRQPSEIKSNIRNMSNSQEPVMGYFDIYDVKRKRIFIDRDEFPIDRSISSGYFHCETLSISPSEIEDYVNNGYNIIEPERFGRWIIGWFVAKKDCSDCRTQGTEIKPAFWEE